MDLLQQLRLFLHCCVFLFSVPRKRAKKQLEDEAMQQNLQKLHQNGPNDRTAVPPPACLKSKTFSTVLYFVKHNLWLYLIIGYNVDWHNQNLCLTRYKTVEKVLLLKRPATTERFGRLGHFGTIFGSTTFISVKKVQNQLKLIHNKPSKAKTSTKNLAQNDWSWDKNDTLCNLNFIFKHDCYRIIAVKSTKSFVF